MGGDELIQATAFVPRADNFCPRLDPVTQEKGCDVSHTHTRFFVRIAVHRDDGHLIG